jgi:hypothetical protein
MTPRILIGALALLFLPATGDFRHETREGTSVQRLFTLTRDMAHESTTMSLDGEELPQRPGERTDKATLTLIFTDHVEKSSDDEVQEFRRSYDEIGGTLMTEVEQAGREATGPNEIEVVSDLAGEEVLFTRGDEGFTPKAVDDDLDEELLLDLSSELTFAWFLPEDSPEEGDTWSIDLAHIAILTRPGGDLSMHPEGSEYERPGTLEYEREGDFDLTYAGTREVDGDEFEVIKISIDLTSTRDMTEIVLASQGDLPEGSPQLKSFILSSDLEGEGEMLWDSAAGRMASLQLEFEVQDTRSQNLDVQTPDGERDLERVTIAVGTTTLHFHTADAE